MNEFNNNDIRGGVPVHGAHWLLERPINAPSCSSSNHDTTTTDQRPPATGFCEWYMLVWMLHFINAMLSGSLSPLSTTSLAHWLIRLEIILTNFKSKMQAEGWRWTTSVLHPPTLPSTGQTHSDLWSSAQLQYIYLPSIHPPSTTRRRPANESVAQQSLNCCKFKCISMIWLMNQRWERKVLLSQSLFHYCESVRRFRVRVISDRYRYRKQSPVVSVHSELNQEGSLKMIVVNWNDSSTLAGQ